MEEIKQNENIIGKDARKKANIYFFTKVGINLLLILLGTIFLNVFLYRVHIGASLDKQKRNSEIALSTATEILERNLGNAETLTQIYHEGNQRTLDNIELLFSQGIFASMKESDESIRVEIFQNLADQIGMNYLFLMSEDGRIIISQDEALSGMNPAVEGYLTQENVNRLLSTTVDKNGNIDPVLVKNRFGTYYFYSKPYTFEGSRYFIVIGADASIIQEQTEALGDMSAVLSRMSVINDGFLFAVDKKENLFRYYKEGENLLTGRNVFVNGLTAKALQDGYNGTETIRGVPYYCVSRAFGEDTVLCAAVRNDSIQANRTYVFFWPLLGFVLVMIICLAYAVIVRNDFVRRAVATKRFTLWKHSKNPIFFDESVFIKVVPLIFAGVLAVFGIAFYTQTLVDITGGIAEANVALSEVEGRYLESQDSSEVVENYYNEYFLSTARTLAFLIEENPAYLNETTDHYYMTYDEDGNRLYVLDDEGNALRSISESEALQKLCDDNEIDAIYLYDRSGRTIATSTPNWFFTLSLNEEDQSYPFRQLLDGKVDSYVQKHMTNELGEETQYFGVDFHYYTTKDENGNTVYVSRSDFERAAAESGNRNAKTAGGITKHNSMIQVEMDEDVASKLLAPTTADAIFSTNMLDGGAVILFDSTPEHVCAYSPVKASIGKTAAELGVSSNAFTGMDYYGFSNINGINYFTYFRYIDEDYYAATCILKNSIFAGRANIAILTAIVCLALLLVLILTVTITTQEEEQMYATMSESQEKRTLNAAIFNIILPSGRSTSTQKAASRWDNRYIGWREKGPEQKLGTILIVVFCLLLAYLALAALGIKTSFDDNSIIRYIFSGAWDRGVNVFSLTACALVMIATILIIILFRIPVRFITALLGTRGETVGRLLLSIVRYGATIACIFYCLYLMGIDSGSLLASAGILSLIVGLGAQSLIKDILAGIFIVFEGEFRVGDIVTISDYRGTVMDIGLRTTKILGPAGNIKIYNNSDISGVLNMTKEASVASTTISIEYGQDVDYVEAVLARDLPKLREKNPKILDGPQCLGVSALGESGVDILVICKCQEADIKGMNRFLNKEVLQIFYRNGINVPFPNVTVSELDMTGRKTMADFVPDPEENGQEEEQK